MRIESSGDVTLHYGQWQPRYPKNTEDYDAVVVLGGGIQQRADRYIPSDYEQSDMFGMLGGHMRVHAAAELCLAQRVNSVVFYAGGVSEKIRAVVGQGAPSEARVYADAFYEAIEHVPELISRPEVVIEDRSTTTMTNLKEIFRLIQDTNWEKLGIISSDYHIPRISALHKAMGFSAPPAIDFLSAEGVVMELQPDKYDAEIRQAYESSEAKKRMENERSGLADIMVGKYAVREFQLS